MENKFLKNLISQFRYLGIYQIVGGIVGLGLTVWLISGLKTTSFLLTIILVVAILLYIYSIYCGMLLLNANIAGLKHSSVNQYLQLINISIFGFTFKYISGIGLLVGMDLTDSFLFLFGLVVSQWEIVINGNKELFILNFNITALFLIVFIDKLKKRIQNEQFQDQIASIGQ